MSGASIKILVVDDSAVARAVVSTALRDEDGFEIVGLARDGRDGVDQFARLRPDVIVLDLEMPVLDGFGALREIREIDGDVPVIVFSHLTESSAGAAVEALALGATEIAVKPRALADDSAQDQVRDALAPAIRALAMLTRADRSSATSAPAPTSAELDGSRASAIVVSASTGGPEALGVLLGDLPATYPLPIVIAQQMREVVTTMFARRLDRISALNVVEASDGDVVAPGTAYVAPGSHNLSVHGTASRSHLTLEAAAESGARRPSADVLFSSAAAVFGGGGVALVLSGMGDDGVAGTRRIKGGGGQVIVQDPATCVADRAPRAVIDAGLADHVIPLNDLSSALAGLGAKSAPGAV